MEAARGVHVPSCENIRMHARSGVRAIGASALAAVRPATSQCLRAVSSSVRGEPASGGTRSRARRVLLDVAIGRDHDDGDVGERRIGALLGAERLAVHHRHHQIEQDQARLLVGAAADTSSASTPLLGADGRVAVVLEGLAERRRGCRGRLRRPGRRASVALLAWQVVPEKRAPPSGRCIAAIAAAVRLGDLLRRCRGRARARRSCAIDAARSNRSKSASLIVGGEPGP